MRLRGKEIVVLVAEGFEDLEYSGLGPRGRGHPGLLPRARRSPRLALRKEGARQSMHQ